MTLLPTLGEVVYRTLETLQLTCLYREVLPDVAWALGLDPDPDCRLSSKAQEGAAERETKRQTSRHLAAHESRLRPLVEQLLTRAGRRDLYADIIHDASHARLAAYADFDPSYETLVWTYVVLRVRQAVRDALRRIYTAEGRSSSLPPDGSFLHDPHLTIEQPPSLEGLPRLIVDCLGDRVQAAKWSALLLLREPLGLKCWPAATALLDRHHPIGALPPLERALWTGAVEDMGFDTLVPLTWDAIVDAFESLPSASGHVHPISHAQKPDTWDSNVCKFYSRGRLAVADCLEQDENV